MQVTYLYPSGRRVVAAVLAVGPDFIRVRNHGRTGGFNLHLRDQDWGTAKGTSIRVEAINLSDGGRRAPAPAPKQGHVPLRAGVTETRSPGRPIRAGTRISRGLQVLLPVDQHPPSQMEGPCCRADTAR